MIVFLVSSCFIQLIETVRSLNDSGSSSDHETHDLLSEVPPFSVTFLLTSIEKITVSRL